MAEASSSKALGPYVGIWDIKPLNTDPTARYIGPAAIRDAADTGEFCVGSAGVGIGGNGYSDVRFTDYSS